ncbi:MAG: hypothetical protein HY059_16990 [Proteobacteria bacterium]|nr:hypothetical protein [Pseudomonadota bacterium]
MFIAILIALSACGMKPIYNADNKAIPASAQQLPPEKIENLIILAGQSRGWKFTREGVGHLSAAQDQAKYSAVIDIYFDQKSYRIAYRKSAGFTEKNGMIHEHYNFWIRNLESDINTRFANATIAGAT